MRRRLSSLSALAVVLLVAACLPKKDPSTSPEALAKARADSIAAAQAEAARRAEAARADSMAKAEAAARAAAARAADSASRAEVMANAITATRSALAANIYFDYDRAELTTESRAALDAKLPVLRANAGVRIRISGHTDDRGSDEYNLALGQRRAAAAKRYLVSQGIGEDRIDVVSFGEERPAVQGADDSSWAQNRRDEFEIIVGGESLRVP